MHDCLHASGEVSVLLSAHPEKLNKVEVFSELPEPRGIIVSSLCQSTNQRLAVICKGDFPFPFQTWRLIFTVRSARNPCGSLTHSPGMIMLRQ